MSDKPAKPSEKIRRGLINILSVEGELKRFATKHSFDFGSLYKIAKGGIKQPGIDYGVELLAAIDEWNESGGADADA